MCQVYVTDEEWPYKSDPSEMPLSACKFNYTYKATIADRNDHEHRQKLKIREANEGE